MHGIVNMLTNCFDISSDCLNMEWMMNPVVELYFYAGIKANIFM